MSTAERPAILTAGHSAACGLLYKRTLNNVLGLDAVT